MVSDHAGVALPTIKSHSIIAALTLADTEIPDSQERKESCVNSNAAKLSEVVITKSAHQMRSPTSSKPQSVSLSSSTSNVAASSITSPESSDTEVSNKFQILYI